MKNSNSGKNSLSREWLAGLAAKLTAVPNPGEKKTEQPSVTQKPLAPADLQHDAGNGYNSNSSFLQR